MNVTLRIRFRFEALALGVVISCIAGPAGAQQTEHQRVDDSVAVWLALADSAFSVGAYGVAEDRYVRVLEADPWNSRATYQLAVLRRDDPDESLRLYTRYAELEPTDPWGYMAVGDAYARVRSYGEGLRWYDLALALAPDERDAVIGRARILAQAGYTDEAIDAYAGWVAPNGSDAEAWNELSRQQQRAGRYRDAITSRERAVTQRGADDASDGRLRYLRHMAAPAVVSIGGKSFDSDGNSVVRFGVSADFLAGGRSRIGFSVGRSVVSDDFQSPTVDRFAATMQWRPRAALRVEGRFGIASSATEDTSDAKVDAVLHLRTRYRAPAGGVEANLGFRHDPLDASPLLVTNSIVTDDLRAGMGFPIHSRLRFRAAGRLTAVGGGAETNWRRGVSTVMVFAARELIEVSAQFHHLSFRSPTSDGYFAPRLAQTLEAGSYMEFYPSWATLIALDLGIGVQRTARHDEPASSWHPTFRLWAQAAVPLGGPLELNVEIEAYDVRIGNVIAARSATWRYVAITTSFRVAAL